VPSSSSDVKRWRRCADDRLAGVPVTPARKMVFLKQALALRGAQVRVPGEIRSCERPVRR
jgi:hypothetical protein